MKHTSIWRGVRWYRGRWRVEIKMPDGTRKYIGTYKEESKAAEMYMKIAHSLCGSGARLLSQRKGYCHKRIGFDLAKVEKDDRVDVFVTGTEPLRKHRCPGPFLVQRVDEMRGVVHAADEGGDKWDFDMGYFTFVKVIN